MLLYFFKRSLTVSIVFVYGFIAQIFAQAPDTLWTKRYGGSNGDYGNAVRQTTDGGYIITGQTGAVVGQPDSGDIWLLRTGAQGDTIWTKRFGGSRRDEGYSVQETSDNGYIIAGYTYSYGAGDRDVWLLRTDESGDTLWTKIIGGTSGDYARCVQQTSDHGFIVAGGTYSYGAGISDVLLIRIDSQGDTLWTKTFGGPGIDFADAVQQTADNGFILTGRYFSTATGASDLWLIRTDANGDSLWTRTYNGPHFTWSVDYGSDIQKLSDGGFIVTGVTNGQSGTTNNDIWLLRTDDNGDTLWTRQYGGVELEQAVSLHQTKEGGFIIAGFIYASGIEPDAFIVRTDTAGDSLWSKKLGSSANDQATSILQTADGGYIISGFTNSSGAGGADVWLVRVDSENPTAVQPKYEEITPFQPRLKQNYPNPFNPVTRIDFTLVKPGIITLKIYDILGQEITTLAKGWKDAGEHVVIWDAQGIASGVYTYRLLTGDFIQTRKMLLLR